MGNVFLILFLIILALYLLYVFFIIYHLIRFGIGSLPKILAFIFLIGSFFFFLLAIAAFSQVSWDEILKFISEKIKVYFPF